VADTGGVWWVNYSEDGKGAESMDVVGVIVLG